MGWVIEDIAGTKNSSNTAFTISAAPFADSLIVIHGANKVRRVGGTPQPEQFSHSGANITMGRAPASGEPLWARYFVE